MSSAHGLWLSGAIGAVLCLASAAGAYLKRRYAAGQPHEGIDNLRIRVRSWWIMAALLGLVFWAGDIVTLCFFAVISLAALREYLSVQPTLGRGVVGVVICIGCIAFIPALLTLKIPGFEGRNIYLPVFLLLVAQSSDVLQYLWGKLCGKRLIAPGISPSKTVVGYLGGTLSATLVGAAVWWITPFPPTEAAWVALLITQLGFAGGLILSAQKRTRGIKDWGTLINGHGGVLDRLDSLWLPAPVFYALLKFGWAAA